MMGALAPAICVKVARHLPFPRHVRSVKLIEEATRLDWTPDQRAQLEVFLGSAKADMGDETAALAHYRDAARRAQSSTPAVLAMVRISRLHCRHMRLDAAREILRTVEDRLKRDPGLGYLFSEVAEAPSVVAWLDRDPAAAAVFAERALDLSDHPHSTGLALKTWG